VGASLREAGFRVSWVGPARAHVGDSYGIEFHMYPSGGGRLARLLNHGRARRWAGRITDADVYIGVEPDSAEIAIQLARRSGGKAVFDIHETYHDDMLDRWVPGSFKPVIGELVKRRLLRTCDRSDLVIGAYETVLAPYCGTNAPTMLLHNCVPRWFGEGGPGAVMPDGRDHISAFHGKFTVDRGIAPALRAARQASDALGRQVRIMLFRGFDSPEQEDAQLRALDQDGLTEYLDLRERASYRDIPGVMRADCDIGMLMYPRRLGVRGLPNRLFEYLAVGLPVLGPSYGVEVARIVQDVGCGILVDTEDVDAVARGIVELATDPDRAAGMGRAGYRSFLDRYNWEAEVEPVLEWIRHVSENGRSRKEPAR
jgi:glycosyltransferase involved in cell wall biosynthesis